jgi:hypothetical protein
MIDDLFGDKKGPSSTREEHRPRHVPKTRAPIGGICPNTRAIKWQRLQSLIRRHGSSHVGEAWREDNNFRIPSELVLLRLCGKYDLHIQ